MSASEQDHYNIEELQLLADNIKLRTPAKYNCQWGWCIFATNKEEQWNLHKFNSHGDANIK